ncbi:hypothetical protein PIB30_010352 [Stylosanthes scabra]|uniref:Uncharacterized protein n=1 Tax=Stylosanthes scabra TaxID=79078 RepID=A0ABU6V809_9FABA|nr:hypothetical protein [Stylosanthes scabra]
MSEPDALWVEVLKQKYIAARPMMEGIMAKQADSQLWKKLVKELGQKVAEFRDENGEWNLLRMEQLLSSHVVNKIRTIPPPRNDTQDMLR